jgi:hypothetical protein
LTHTLKLKLKLNQKIPLFITGFLRNSAVFEVDMAHILKFDQKFPQQLITGFLRNSAVFKVDMAHILKFDQKIPPTTY